jgi:hypothetical protein
MGTNVGLMGAVNGGLMGVIGGTALGSIGAIGLMGTCGPREYHGDCLIVVGVTAWWVEGSSA